LLDTEPEGGAVIHPRRGGLGSGPWLRVVRRRRLWCPGSCRPVM